MAVLAAPRQVGSIENDVVFGHDGQLFLAHGGHRVLDYALGRRPVDPASIETFVSNIATRARSAENAGVPYLHVVFPDKQSVLSEQFVVPDPVRLGEIYLRPLLGAGIRTFYPLDLLRACDLPTFKRTDTHLTDFGSIMVATRVAEILSGSDLATHLEHLKALLTGRRRRAGDLGGKLEPNDESEEVLAVLDWRRSYYQNDIPGGSNGGVDIYQSPDAVFKKRLLWFGDSFGREAVKFLSYFFAEILFLRTPFFHPEFVEQMNPDFIVSDNVERYLASCGPDARRPSFHMFPFLRGNEYRPGARFAEAFSAILSYPRAPYQEFFGMAS